MKAQPLVAYWLKFYVTWLFLEAADVALEGQCSWATRMHEDIPCDFYLPCCRAHAVFKAPPSCGASPFAHHPPLANE